MRTLKFRSWRDNKMVFFSLRDLAIEAEGEFYWIDDNPPIMQFTGLTDRLGVEIYEGDIVNFDSTQMLVLWLQDENHCGFIFHQEVYSEAHTPTSNCEVIGNIYENKELLK